MVKLHKHPYHLLISIFIKSLTDIVFLFVFAHQKNLMWNTVTVQYNPLIEEEWDEHFKVTCEYGYDFWKTVTFPFLDVEYVYQLIKPLIYYHYCCIIVCLASFIQIFCYRNNIIYIRFNRVATGNPVVFTLSPPECYMEIRYGYGTTGNRVGGPVRVGDPLTLIIYMRSKYGNDSKI